MLIPVQDSSQLYRKQNKHKAILNIFQSYDEWQEQSRDIYKRGTAPRGKHVKIYIILTFHLYILHNLELPSGRQSVQMALQHSLFMLSGNPSVERPLQHLSFRRRSSPSSESMQSANLTSVKFLSVANTFPSTAQVLGDKLWVERSRVVRPLPPVCSKL